VRQSMGADGVAQSFFIADQPLIGEATENSGEPFAVFKTKKDSGPKKGGQEESPHRHTLEVRIRQIAIEEGTEKHFLQKRHHERCPKDPNCDEPPGPSRTASERQERIPTFAGEFQFG